MVCSWHSGLSFFSMSVNCIDLLFVCSNGRWRTSRSSRSWLSLSVTMRPLPMPRSHRTPPLLLKMQVCVGVSAEVRVGKCFLHFLFVCPRSSCKWFSTNQAQIYSYLKSVRGWCTVIFICNLYNAMLVLFGRLLFLGLFFLFYFKTVSYNLGIAFSLWITVFVEAFPNVFANCSCIVNISICSLIHWCQVQCLTYLSAIQYWAFSDNLLSSGTELLRI